MRELSHEPLAELGHQRLGDLLPKQAGVLHLTARRVEIHVYHWYWGPLGFSMGNSSGSLRVIRTITIINNNDNNNVCQREQH